MMDIKEHIVKIGNKFRLLSHTGKNLGTFDSKAEAEKHEKQVNYFKSKESGVLTQKVENGIITIMDGDQIAEALAKDASFDSIHRKLSDAINARVAAGMDMDGDDDGEQDAIDYGRGYCYACVMDVYPNTCIYSMDGKMFQIDYTIDQDGDVQLANMPMPVKMAYVGANESFCESYSFTDSPAIMESGYDAAKKQLTLTVIKPGLSKNNRFYGGDMLKKSVGIFENAKMFADHYTDKQTKEKPEGSVRDWVGNITKVWAESDGTIRANAAIIQPWFANLLEGLNSHNLLSQMGVSIRAAGTVSDGKMEGKNVKVVESLDAARSVDFVTFAGAGGQVDAA